MLIDKKKAARLQERAVRANRVEDRPFGKEAAEANRKLVAGKRVRLEFDVQQRDRHGRLLAYVHLEDDTFVNTWLVERGYAQVMTVPPKVKYQEIFLKLQREARQARRGLWR